MNNLNSLHYAVAQMLIIGFNGFDIDEHHPITQAIREEGLGGVILFDRDLKNPGHGKNIESPEQVKTLNKKLQTLALSSGIDNPLPLFIAVDYEGGKVSRLKPERQFPETLPAQIFATLSDKSAAIEARRMARTLQELGFNLDFAPLIDVNVYPDNPIIGQLGRSFSADPNIVTKYAHIVATAFSESKITFCYKHFPGHGSSRGDSHLGIVDVSNTWQPEELIPYQQLLKKSPYCDMIMSAHIINRQLDPSGLPASLSPTILTNLLRQEMHYKGLLVADDLQMKAITDAFGLEESIVMAINAGNDLLIFGNQCGDVDYSAEEIIDLIIQNIVNGKISRQRINESFERITRAKSKYLKSK